MSSHYPVFAGESPIEDLSLVVRDAGVAKAIQTPALNLSDVAEQLGVEPSDQITGYNACIFVEGSSDIEFWKTVASKLKEAGHVDADFDDKQIDRSIRIHIHAPKRMLVDESKKESSVTCVATAAESPNIMTSSLQFDRSKSCC